MTSWAGRYAAPRDHRQRRSDRYRNIGELGFELVDVRTLLALEQHLEDSCEDASRAKTSDKTRPHDLGMPPGRGGGSAALSKHCTESGEIKTAIQRPAPSGC
ncbi:hypothetical protein [Mesorhizobium sp. STM 4661]|uniref:hypothetical protein n=1 Tax=Mesorhizobium sp. STM 4661 TaxID=1297570 RepID=UPI0002BDC66D|nr:hypothetical protein [Mesorhizobium sp. STM 4661]CCV15088.1 hypothetical protein MESS4_750023 [Mesorhizobium sp. STM 4661]